MRGFPAQRDGARKFRSGSNSLTLLKVRAEVAGANERELSTKSAQALTGLQRMAGEEFLRGQAAAAFELNALD